MRKYSMHDYGTMAADHLRIVAFATALERAVKPESIVVDIGTGTGIFALLACRLGARRVYAIEPDDAILVARQIAIANDYADRIVFIQAMSTEVTLEERADVVVADIGGIGHHIVAMADARKRLLKPEGTLIPGCDSYWAAVVEAPGIYEDYSGAWVNDRYGLNMEPAQRMATNIPRSREIKPEYLVSDAQCWARLDYTKVERPDLSGEMLWTDLRAAWGHGIALWLQRTVADGLCLSCAPSRSDTSVAPRIYGVLFFPWSSPVALSSGDAVRVDLRARLVGEDYVWLWKTRVLEQGDPKRVKAEFAQADFFGVPLSSDKLARWTAQHVPARSADGEIDAFILSKMNGELSAGEIAAQLHRRFSSHVLTWPDALTRVARLSEKYSRQVSAT